MPTGNKTYSPESSSSAVPPRASDAASTPSEPYSTTWRAESSRGDASEIDLRVCLHSLRRLWWKVLVAGACLAVPAELYVYRSVKDQYAASALIHFARDRKVPLGDQSDLSADGYAAYRTTLAQLVKSRFFLKAVAARSEIAGLPNVQSASDPVDLLKGKLQADFPDRGEVMQLTAKDADPEQAFAVVNAAVGVFLDGTADLDRTRRATTLEALEKLEQEIAKQLSRFRLELARVTQTREGTAATSALRKEQAAMQTLATLDHDLLQQELELRLAASKRNSAHPPEVDDPSEVEKRIEGDPIISKLRLDLEQLNRAEMCDRVVCTPAAAEQARQKRQAVVSLLEERLRQRIAELGEHSARRDLINRERSEAAIQELQTRIEIIADQQKQLEAVLPDVVQKSGVAVDLVRRKGEILRAEQALDQLLREKQRLQLASGDIPRATLLDAAERPTVPANHATRQSYLLAAGLGSFLLPVLIAGVWGVCVKLVNGPADVERKTGLSVLGTLPDVPPRVIRRWDQPSRIHCHLQTRLTESVDVVLTAVREQMGHLQQRKLLVCSAAREEGKSILAWQLAVNLAQTGYRTLLVDFDLRRPILHTAMHLALDKGASEVLRGELTALDALQNGPFENLWVVAAGTWDERTRIALNRGRMIEILDEYQPLFQAVIVLGAPLLAVVDSRLVAPHTDGVVLSVKRDVSRVPELAAAQRLLEKLKVNLLGVALTGGRAALGASTCSPTRQTTEA